MQSDMTKERLSGKLCTTSHDQPIIWNGHLCEGANLTDIRNDNFCLWTRCGSRDVPAGQAHEGSRTEVTCESCRAILQGEDKP